jgi:hypothetical protein
MGSFSKLKLWTHLSAAWPHEAKGQMKLNTPIGDAEEEFYVFLRMSEAELSQAIEALGLITKFKNEFVRLCLLKQASIDYCKPFTNSHGFFSRHRLPDKVVPSKMRGLHKKLWDLRNQVFAHTDIKARNPRLHAWTKGHPKLIFPIVFKTHDYPTLLGRIEEIRSLFRAVQDSIRTQQMTLEAKFSTEIASLTES